MYPNHFPEITTERLLLRKLMQTDWEMISYLRTDTTINKLVKRPSAETKDKAIEFITKTNDSIDQNKIYYWCITENNNQKMIGSICLWNFSKDRKTAEVGYDLSPAYKRRGLMDEAMKSVLKFGFNTLNLELIEAYTHKENLSSKSLLERNLFKLMKDKNDKDNTNNINYELKKPGIAPTDLC